MSSTKFRYQHLRGTTEKWLLSTIIPLDGELIIEERADGSYEIKVGDGIHTFVDLPYASKEAITKADLCAELQVEIDNKATIAYVDDAIVAIPTPDVSGQIDMHNNSVDTHNDIRVLIQTLEDRLNNTTYKSDVATIADICAVLGNGGSDTPVEPEPEPDVQGTTIVVDNAIVEETVLSFTEDEATVESSTLVIK